MKFVVPSLLSILVIFSSCHCATTQEAGLTPGVNENITAPEGYGSCQHNEVVSCCEASTFENLNGLGYKCRKVVCTDGNAPWVMTSFTCNLLGIAADTNEL